MVSTGTAIPHGEKRDPLLLRKRQDPVFRILSKRSSPSDVTRPCCSGSNALRCSRRTTGDGKARWMSA